MLCGLSSKQYVLPTKSVFDISILTCISLKVKTSSSIKEITADILNRTYNSFYQPSNMFVVISGKVNKNIIDIIKNNKCINRRKTNQVIKCKTSSETKEVVNEYKCIEVVRSLDGLLANKRYTIKNKKLVSFRSATTKREISDEQRKALAQRMRDLNKSKSTNNNTGEND